MRRLCCSQTRPPAFRPAMNVRGWPQPHAAGGRAEAGPGSRRGGGGRGGGGSALSSSRTAAQQLRTEAQQLQNRGALHTFGCFRAIPAPPSLPSQLPLAAALLLSNCPARQIKVKTLTGKEIEIDIESDDLISRIKERVEEKEGIPPPQQRLIFGGKQMSDDKNASL